MKIGVNIIIPLETTPPLQSIIPTRDGSANFWSEGDTTATYCRDL